MPNSWFQFKQFTVWHHRCAMKVGTDGVLLGAWINPENSGRILDIGTGTGLITLMLAQKTTILIDAIDIDADAALQAQENFSASKWSSRLQVFHCSLQEFSSVSDNKYSTIVSNPPFFINSLKAATEQRSIARHTDSLSSSDLLEGVNYFLTENGSFFVILPYVEAQVFIVDAALNHLYCVKKLNCRPAPEKKISRVLMQFSRNRNKLVENELTIRDSFNEYSREYRELTKEYYLGF